jgi:Domain of unknown function (DUF3291)
MTYHLAQINVGRFHYPADDPRNADFMDNLGRINAIAESSSGYIWRLKDDSGNATAIQAFDDPKVIVNMSVWDSIENLQLFAYRSEHVKFLRRRAEWFGDFGAPFVALWWVEAGHLPTPAEGREKLEHLARHGSTPAAFTFREKFGPPNT